jgi:hypothetical protein
MKYFKGYKSYLIEGVIVFLSVLFSFYITGLNTIKKDKISKNISLKDLSNTMINDTFQIREILKNKELCITNLALIIRDIDNKHIYLTDDVFFETYIQTNLGQTFMPRKGIFNQLISTGGLELIKSKELKNNLIEIFNHLKERNESISRIIDELVFIKYQPLIYSKFRIRMKQIGKEATYGRTIITDAVFNESFYYSNEFYEILNSSLLYSVAYKNLMQSMLQEYKKSINLIKVELSSKK